jgi:predicted secreted hydrolase
MTNPLCKFLAKLMLAACATTACVAEAAPPQFTEVLPNQRLQFPRDYGAHPSFHTEWWYVTGWLHTADNKPLGFQVTFFRSATENDTDNPSQFSPKQLIIGHAALSDPAVGILQHEQKTEREGFGLAYAKVGDTDVKLDNWQFKRDAQGNYLATVETATFSLQLSLKPTREMLLEGDQGFSKKGPEALQASYYYSQPHLQVSGNLVRAGKQQAVSGDAWLDHEWSSHYLDNNASGWDWLGLNLDDGGALMAFQIRDNRGGKLWAHATLRDAAGKLSQFGTEQLEFKPKRFWHSPRTNANYPVATEVHVDSTSWELVPLQDDQEQDTRLSSGAVYWEGAVRVKRDGQEAGHGYLELTGYVSPLKL